MTASAYLDDQPGPGSLVMRYLPGVGLAEVTAGTLGPADRAGDPNGGGTPSTAAAEQVRLPASPQKNKKLSPTESNRLVSLSAHRFTLMHHLMMLLTSPYLYPLMLDGEPSTVIHVDRSAIESAIRRALASIDAEIERLTAGGADVPAPATPPPNPSDAP